MVQQPAAHGVPGMPFHRGSGGATHGASLRFVPGEVEDPVAETEEVLRCVEPSRAAVVDELGGATCSHRNDRDPAGHRLLHRLAERLVWAGVHGDVECRG